MLRSRLGDGGRPAVAGASPGQRARGVVPLVCMFIAGLAVQALLALFVLLYVNFPEEAVIFWLGSLFQGLCPYFEPVAVVAGSLRLGFQEWRSVIHVTPPDPYPR